MASKLTDNVKLCGGLCFIGLKSRYHIAFRPIFFSLDADTHKHATPHLLFPCQSYILCLLIFCFHLIYQFHVYIIHRITITR